MHLLEVVKSTEAFSYKYRWQNRATMSQNGRGEMRQLHYPSNYRSRNFIHTFL